MQGDETPEDRLEAALERIAHIVETPDQTAAVVAERLDRIIARVRTALGDAQQA